MNQCVLSKLLFHQHLKIVCILCFFQFCFCATMFSKECDTFKKKTNYCGRRPCDNHEMMHI